MVGGNKILAAIFLPKNGERSRTCRGVARRAKAEVFSPMRDYLSSFICEKIVKKLIISER